MSITRNKFGRFEKITEVYSNEGKTVNSKPEQSSSEVTLILVENLARVVEALSLSTANKLSPLLKKVNPISISGMVFNVEKYPPYFKDLCTQLNNIHCTIESIASTIDAVDI